MKSPAYVIPVEVKYREDASLSEHDGIVLYARSDKAKVAYWITRREEDFTSQRFKGLETRFLKIPAHIFCYLIGQAERLLWK